MTKRQTITFDQTLYSAFKGLGDSDRLLYYDILFEHFLDGKELPKEFVSEPLRFAIACTTPMLRKMQSKKENGDCKKIDTRTKGLSCSSGRSENKRIRADGDFANMDIPNPYNNKVNNIYKILTSTNLNARTGAQDLFKTIDRPIERVLDELSTSDQTTFDLLFQSIKHIESTEELKICGKPTKKYVAFETIKTLLRRPGATKILRALRDELESTRDVNNPAAYFTTMMINAAKRPDAPAPVKSKFNQRRYSDDELNAIYDDLSGIEL